MTGTVVLRKVTGAPTCKHEAQWVMNPETGSRIKVVSKNGLTLTKPASVRWCVQCGALYTGDVWMTPTERVG
jgi:hypothetical protein